MSATSNFEVVAIAEGRVGMLASVVGLSAAQQEEAKSGKAHVDAATLASVGKAAIIPVRGVLLDEWSPQGPKWGATGYNYIRGAVSAASRDGSVMAVVLDIDSPGGMVSGLAETCALIESRNAEETGKPIFTTVRSLACSAAYAIAASTDHIMAGPSSTLGSIGCRLAHISIQSALESAGIKVTEISSHPGKTFGSPYSDLSAAARARLQADVDDAGAAFVAQVARRRHLSVAAVNGLDAAAFPVSSATGRKTALSAGLIDGVISADDALSSIGTLSRGTLAKYGQTTEQLMKTAAESIVARQSRGKAISAAWGQSGSHHSGSNASQAWDRAYSQIGGRTPEDVGAVWEAAIKANNPNHKF